MLVHVLDFICFVVHLSLLQFFLIFGFFWMKVRVPAGMFFGLGMLGSNPRDILDVFLDLSAAISFC